MYPPVAGTYGSSATTYHLSSARLPHYPSAIPWCPKPWSAMWPITGPPSSTLPAPPVYRHHAGGYHYHHAPPAVAKCHNPWPSMWPPSSSSSTALPVSGYPARGQKPYQPLPQEQHQQYENQYQQCPQQQYYPKGCYKSQYDRQEHYQQENPQPQPEPVLQPTAAVPAEIQAVLDTFDRPLFFPARFPPGHETAPLTAHEVEARAHALRAEVRAGACAADDEVAATWSRVVRNAYCGRAFQLDRNWWIGLGLKV